MVLRAVIVDDEKQSRETLTQLVERYCDNVIVEGAAANVKEALQLIAETSPDILFLDVELTDTETGFDLLKRIHNIDFSVIFTTAFNQYAVQAIKVSALDYLLKPINIDELIAAVEKARTKAENESLPQRLDLLLGNLSMENAREKRLVLRTVKGFEFISTGEIIRCEADSTCTQAILSKSVKKTDMRNLGELSKMLPQSLFFRTHNSHLINRLHIERYIKGEGGYVVMADGASVPVSRNRRTGFLDWM